MTGIPPCLDTTNATADEFSFLWTIENFTECVRLNADELHSPEFNIIDSELTTHLILVTRVRVGDEDGCYCYCEHWDSSVSVHVSILIHGEWDTPLPIEKDATNKTCWINLRDIPRSDVFKIKRSFFLPQDTMTLRVRIFDTNKRLLKPDKEVFARTVIDVESKSFNWSIKNFSALPLKEKKTYTFKFSPGHPQVRITFYLVEMSQDQKCGVLLTVHFKEAHFNFMKCKIFLLDAKGNACKSIRQEYTYDPHSDVHNLCSFSFFVSRRSLMEDKERLLPNEVLTWQFDFVGIGHTSNEFEEDNITIVPSLFAAADCNKQCVEKYNLGKHLLEQKKFCDATLQVEGKAFDVHKSVLCAMSPVFLAMFERSMIESQTGVVDIPDLDAATLQDLLVYIYTGYVSELQWNNVYKLYYAADKYRILSLKEKCSVFMAEQLNTKNVCDALLFADRHRDVDLKLACQQFIDIIESEFIKEISDEFYMFEENNTEIYLGES